MPYADWPRAQGKTPSPPAETERVGSSHIPGQRQCPQVKRFDAPRTRGELKQTSLEKNTLIIQSLFCVREKGSIPRHLSCDQTRTQAYNLIYCRYANVTSTSFLSQNTGRGERVVIDTMLPSQFLNSSLWVLQTLGLFPHAHFYVSSTPSTYLPTTAQPHDGQAAFVQQLPYQTCRSFQESTQMCPQLFSSLLPAPNQQGAD